MLGVVYGKDEKENINKQWQVKSSKILVLLPALDASKSYTTLAGQVKQNIALCFSLSLHCSLLCSALLSTPLPGNCKPCCSSSPPRRPAAQRSPCRLLPCLNRCYCGAPTTNPNREIERSYCGARKEEEIERGTYGAGASEEARGDHTWWRRTAPSMG